MIKNVIGLIIVVAIAATVAYQMGWLSNKGEQAYDEIEDAVKDTIKR